MSHLKIALLTLISCSSFAQLPFNSFMLRKKGFFGNLSYENSSFNKYYEGGLLRSNTSLGRVSSNNVTLHMQYGVTDHFNIMAQIPRISTKSSAGIFLGNKGIQDISAAFRINVFKPESRMATILSVGVFKPMRAYNVEFLPLAIGRGAKGVNVDLMLRYKLENGIYLATNGNFTSLKNASLFRDAYLLDDQIITSNEVAIPDSWKVGVRTGFINELLHGELFAEQSKSLSGDDIGYNMSPFLSNKVSHLKTGLYLKYQPSVYGLNTRINYTLAGRNTPKDIQIMAGVTYYIKGRSDRFEY